MSGEKGPNEVQVEPVRTTETPPFWASSRLAGENYVAVLSRWHRILKPKTYFEIGVASGATLELATCASIAVDPVISVTRPILANKPFCCCFQMTSDRFFDEHTPAGIFARPIDLAFIDGMHLYEYTLRDFINTERYCKKNSVICLHDCVPVDSYVGRRDVKDTQWQAATRNPDWWAGDVWKAVAILLRYRPDLKIHAFNASPTGLVAITNLDPASTVLCESYFDIISEFREMALGNDGEAYLSELNIIDTLQTDSHERLSRMFWL